MSRRLLGSAVGKVRAATLAASLVAVATAVLTGWGQPARWALLALALAVAATELAVVHVSFRRQRWTFSLTEGVIGAAYLFAPGAWSVLAVVLGVLLAQRVRRQPPLKLAFNVALFAVSTAAGAATAQALGGTVAAACAGLSVFWIVNTGLVAVPMAVMTEQRLRVVLWESVSFSTLQESGTSSIGLLAAWLTLHAPFGLLGLVIPVVLLFVSYDEQSARTGEARLFAELAHGQERAGERSVDVSAEVVLIAAARLFGGADVEMVLLGADGPVRYAGDESGVARRRTESGAFDEPWVLAALGGGIRTGTADGRPFCSAVIGDRQQPLAVLLARRPAAAAPFGRREVALARLLVGQGESWLSTARLTVERDVALGRADAAGDAARALGDIGAVTAPTLGVLRDSAGRLARLAASMAGPADVGGIVEELHAVERAVASLLGAVALAADPDLALTSGFDLPEQVPAEDWTTTGVLPVLRAEPAWQAEPVLRAEALP